VLVCWQVSGTPEQRVFWTHHYAGTQGLLFVVDAGAQEGVARALAELEEAAAHALLAGVPVALVCVGGRLGWAGRARGGGKVREWQVRDLAEMEGAAGEVARWLAEEAT